MCVKHHSLNKLCILCVADIKLFETKQIKVKFQRRNVNKILPSKSLYMCVFSTY